jgi:hypothetical protein
VERLTWCSGQKSICSREQAETALPSLVYPNATSTVLNW